MNRKWLSEPNIVILNIKSCILIYPILRPSSKDKLTRYLLKFWYFYCCIPKWYPDLYQRSRVTSYWGHTLSSRPTPEAFILCQPKEISVLSEWGSFLRIHSIVKKNKHKSQKIEVIKDWPELKAVHNIQAFLGFANFY